MKELAKKLFKDLVVYDLETTGLDTEKDQILQFHATRIDHKTGKTKELTFLCKPTCEIHPKAAETHGYTTEKLAKEPKFSSFVKKVVEFFKGADIATYNGNRFDNLILARQMAENGIQGFLDNRLSFDAFEVYKTHINKKLAGALEFYCGKEAVGAHDAKNDVNFTIQIINAQLKREGLTLAEVLQKTSDDKEKSSKTELERYLKKDGDDWILTFSKNKGIKLSEVDVGFLHWIMGKEFPECLKKVVKDYLK